MYRPKTPPRTKAATIALVALLHAGLILALLNANGTITLPVPEQVTQVFDVTDPPPPPPIVEEVKPDKPKPKKEEGAASAKNIESKASPVVAPKPKVEVPAKPPVVAAPTPNKGPDTTQGASPTPGPGTGAGGSGTGTGSGGSGSGSGGGGMGGSGPRLASRPLTERNYPSAMARNWPPGARVLVAVRVQLDGRATDCKINKSSGDPAIDAETCRLVQSKLRFRPAVDGSGRPYVAWYGYMQYPVNF